MMVCSDEWDVAGDLNLYFKVRSVFNSCVTYKQLDMAYDYGLLAVKQGRLFERSLDNMHESYSNILQNKFKDKIKQVVYGD